MAIPVFILGASGSGKTYSIRNLPKDSTGILSVRKGTLPFEGGKDFKIVKRATYKIIYEALAKQTMKRYIIDDSQFLMVDEFMAKANESGYQKFTQIGKNFNDLLETIAFKLPDDIIVYFLHHTQKDADGTLKAKTVGQMLDNYLTLEACSDYVLYAMTDGKDHYFVTQSDGTNTAKSPAGLFDRQIPNDLNIVDQAIRQFEGIK